MKRNFLLICLLALTQTFAFAQDVIVKKDNTTILSKVLEITADCVKYQKWDNLEGPTYVINKSEILAINYQNGTKEDFSVLNVEKDKQPNQIQSQTYSSNQNFYDENNITPNTVDFLKRDDLMRRSRGCKVGSIVCTVLGSSAAVAGIICFTCDAVGAGVGLIAGGVVLATCGGGGLAGYSIRLKKEALNAEILSVPLNNKANVALCSFGDNYKPMTSLGVGVSLKF